MRANAAMVRSALYQRAFTSTGLPMRGVTTLPPTLASIHVSCTPSSPAGEYDELADRAKAGFDRFWSDSLGYCYDVLDGPGGDDPSLRPNQIFAVSLEASPFGEDRQRAVV